MQLMLIGPTPVWHYEYANYLLSVPHSSTDTQLSMCPALIIIISCGHILRLHHPHIRDINNPVFVVHILEMMKGGAVYMLL